MPAQLNSIAPQTISPRAEVDLPAAPELLVPADLARATYRELRQSGLTDTDIMAFAGELLSLVARDVRAQTAAE